MTGRATHGATRGRGTTPEFRSWLAMRQRCYYTKHAKYHRYGGRGIEVGERWRDSFSAFLEDMGPRPAGTTLDRINNDGDYTPENCRWATPTQQMETRNTVSPNSEKTHCPAGHRYSGDNVRVTAQGHRKCRACGRKHSRDQRARAREAG